MTWDDLTWEQKRGAVLAQALFRCEICNDAPAIEVDHIWPKSDGGTDDRWNLRAACRACNAKKGDSVYSADVDRTPALLVMGVRWNLRQAEVRLQQAVHWHAVLTLMNGGESCGDSERRIAHEREQCVAEVDLVDLMESLSASLKRSVMESGHLSLAELES